MTKKVGLIGCGAIGTVLAETVDRKLVVCDELVIFDIAVDQAIKLKDRLKVPVKIVPSVDDLIAAKPTVIVEAAGRAQSHQYYDKLVATGAEIIS